MLAIIGKIGTAGGTGYTIEFAGSAIRALSMEGRMTVCNMAIEAGARAGLVAVDDKTIDYVKGRSPWTAQTACRRPEWDQAVAYWKGCNPTPTRILTPWSSWTPRRSSRKSPGAPRPKWCCGIDGCTPDPDKEKDANKRGAIERALTYMGLAARQGAERHVRRQGVHRLLHQQPHRRHARSGGVVKQLGQKVAKNVKLALVVPGSGLVKDQAEREGLHKIFIAAGFEWREPGCSMCLAMNADRLEPGERCASTSNRNFEGRQGAGGRTHLVSPAMAAAAAVHGHFVDIRKFCLSSVDFLRRTS